MAAVTGKVFASDVDGGVQKLLNTRKAYYSAQFRDSGAHAWILQKTAFARAQAITKASGRSATIDVPTQGGLGPGGMYSNTGTQRFTPKTHITSVKIGNEGKWGSTKRCELGFSVYSLSGLNSVQPFFVIGSELTVNVGWNDAGGAGGPGLTFKGIVYNFSYNLNANGGFDCTCEAISEGVLAASLRVGAEFETGAAPPPPPAEGTDAPEAPANNMFSLIADEITRVTEDETVKNIPAETALRLDDKKYAFPIIAVAFKLKRTAEGREKADGDEDEANEPAEPIFYVTLETIVDQINKLLSSSGLPFKYTCNSKTTISKVDPYMRSANPLVLMIPGRLNYGDSFNITDTRYEEAIASGDISKMLISVDWLLKTSEEFQKSIGAQLPQDSNQIDTFFQKIFEMIKTYTGSYHLLSLISDPKDPNPKEWSVVDSNNVDSTVSPYVFEVGTKRSMVRAVQLNTKIPSKFAAAAYISAREGNSSLNSDVHVSPGILDAAKKETTFDPTTQLAPIAHDLIKDISETNINKMSAFLSKLKSSKPSTAAPNSLQPAAFDLSITIDGIEGILFGNTISTNYIPSIYAKDVYFTVTNVEHNVSNNDWTTTLSTVMRMK
jgi:hypothetical protein